jgi:hypothetical protein
VFLEIFQRKINIKYKCILILIILFEVINLQHFVAFVFSKISDFNTVWPRVERVFFKSIKWRRFQTGNKKFWSSFFYISKKWSHVKIRSLFLRQFEVFGTPFWFCHHFEFYHNSFFYNIFLEIQKMKKKIIIEVIDEILDWKIGKFLILSQLSFFRKKTTLAAILKIKTMFEVNKNCIACCPAHKNKKTLAHSFTLFVYSLVRVVNAQDMRIRLKLYKY